MPGEDEADCIRRIGRDPEVSEVLYVVRNIVIVMAADVSSGEV